MPDLEYVKTVGRFGLTVGDGADPDETPDTIWCDEGTVQLTPLNTYTKVAGGAPAPWTAGHARIDVPINSEGYLEWSGQPYVWMVDLTSDLVNPKIPAGKATHAVKFVGLKANGIAVEYPATTVRLAADTVTDGVCDLTLLMPVPTAGGTPITVGPRGVSVESMTVEGGNLVYELSDGSTGDAGELPVGPGGSDAGVASYIDDEDSETRARLTAALEPLQDQIDDLILSGAFHDEGAWTATDYTALAIVRHAGGGWYATEAATSADEPGVASLWVALPTGVDPTARSAAEAAQADIDTLESAPLIPRQMSTDVDDDYRAVEMDDQGNMSRGLRPDGIWHHPPGIQAGDGIVGSVPDADHAWAPLVDDQGNLAEPVVGPDGKVIPKVLAAWAERLRVAGTLPSLSKDTPIDWWILAGQSNAVEVTGPLDVTPWDSSGWFVQWTYGTPTIATLGTKPWLGTGVARGWRDRQQNQRRVGILPASAGSSGFSTTTGARGHWQHGVTGTGPDLATSLVTRANAALAASPAGSRIVGVIWSQGESDQALSQATYRAYLDDLIGWVRTQLSDADMPWLISSTNPNHGALAPNGGQTGGAAMMVANLEDTPRRIEHTAYFPGLPDHVDGNADNGVHWSAEGAHYRGRDAMIGRYYEQALLNKAAAAPRTPPGLKITRSGTKATITWEHPATRVTSFTLQTSTNEGGTWTTQTLASTATHTHTMTGLTATDPLWARVAAVSPTGTSYYSLEARA